MRIISKTEHEQLQQKLQVLEELLTDPHCLPVFKEAFSEDEIQHTQLRLSELYDSYLKQLKDLENLIMAYRFHHSKMANKVRVKYRVFNARLKDHAPERESLGLPPLGPVRSKVVLKETTLSRSRYYQTKKKAG